MHRDVKVTAVMKVDFVSLNTEAARILNILARVKGRFSSFRLLDNPASLG